MSVQLISVGFGRETFQFSSASFSAFVVDAPFTRTLPSKKFKRQGSCQRFPVSQHPEINGFLYLDSVAQVPDNTVILLQASHRRGAVPSADGALPIVLRSTGPLLSVNATLCADASATLTGDFLVFQGRGDVATARDLASYGIVVPKNYVNGFMDEEEVAECFTINTVAPQIAEKPRFEAAKDRDGEVVMVPQRRVRKLSIRRSD